MKFNITFILKSGFTVSNIGPFDCFNDAKALSVHILDNVKNGGYFFMNGDEACININCEEIASFTVKYV
ncbi:MAG: hypothetical protein ACRDA3_00175 [Peptostreptococcaceae bacterium]